MKELSSRTAGFTDSVIRRMTRISNRYGAVNLSQGPGFRSAGGCYGQTGADGEGRPASVCIDLGRTEFQGGPGGKAGAFFRGESGSGGGDCRNLRQYGGHDGGYAGGDESGG